MIVFPQTDVTSNINEKTKITFIWTDIYHISYSVTKYHQMQKLWQLNWYIKFQIKYLPL
jgi:hypothetical protein